MARRGAGTDRLPYAFGRQRTEQRADARQQLNAVACRVPVKLLFAVAQLGNAPLGEYGAKKELEDFWVAFAERGGKVGTRENPA